MFCHFLDIFGLMHIQYSSILICLSAWINSNHVVGSCFSKHKVEYKLYFIIRAQIIFVLHSPSSASWQILLHNPSPTSHLSYLLFFCTFPIPSIFALTFSHVFCPSRCPTAYPICPILCPGSALPAGHRQRLPEGRTGVATHTPLSTQLPVASGGRTPNDEQMHTHTRTQRYTHTYGWTWHAAEQVIFYSMTGKATLIKYLAKYICWHDAVQIGCAYLWTCT